MSFNWPALCLKVYEQPLDAWLTDIRCSKGLLSGLLLLVALLSARLCVGFYRIPKCSRVDEKGRAVVWPLYVAHAAASLLCLLLLFNCALNHLCMYGYFISACVCSSVLGAVAFLSEMYDCHPSHTRARAHAHTGYPH